LQTQYQLWFIIIQQFITCSMCLFVAQRKSRNNLRIAHCTIGKLHRGKLLTKNWCLDKCQYLYMRKCNDTRSQSITTDENCRQHSWNFRT